MTAKVAITELDSGSEAYSRALQEIGGIADLNTPERRVAIKVGVFSHRASNHSSVNVVKAIINGFDRVPQVFLAESDNYQGTALERLQIWKELFTERVAPVSLSDQVNSRKVVLAGEEMAMSSILLKPNVLVSTHIMRSFERGSILKNLFGCTPSPKKAKYHKILPPLLADIYEKTGGIDLAVMDGTFFWRGAGEFPIRMNTLIVGRDAVAVETVGATLAGMKPIKNPVLQEFVKRGLGEGDIKNIDIVGTPLEDLKSRFKSAIKQHAQLWRERGGAPKIWASAIDQLIAEQFFTLPNKRTKGEVRKALMDRAVPVEGNLNLVVTTLNRRVQKRLLKREKNGKAWIYWKE